MSPMQGESPLVQVKEPYGRTGVSNPGVHVWYGSMCCSPSMQKHTVKFVTGNYNYETGNMTGILGRLKCEFLEKRRQGNIIQRVKS